ncbi:hypothetical protein HBI73_167080 [Parastagonospora nodorum]|nr:hypothetical protein HBH49_213830 [Parastagonospora nodorum]KAH4801671.1 hypothetical protein HBH61_195110 [Parastagonospora nodorum]KAH5080560.1 hypothetical protein HBI73_167080 [Parastagonospora nodorum]KAH5093420.1 hypothetical protein HBH72_176860 [Parastagonospora nodorum]KAH5178656.1 hypothetical protein HBH76_190280 [Parastagonospora nodorum]
MFTGQIGKCCAQTKEDSIGKYRAFVDQKSSKRIQAKGTAIPEVKDIDIRAWAKQFRSALPKGELVFIYIVDAIAAHILKPLLKVTSTKFDNLYQNGGVKLPAGTDKRVLDRLMGYLGYVCGTSKKPQPMSTNMLMFNMLSICTAGSLLGMDKYTSHVYEKSEAILRIDPPLYEHINAIISVHEEHARLHRIVVQNLAFRVREATIPDPEDFQKYLLDHSELAVAIDATNDAFAAKQRKIADAKHRKASRDKVQVVRKEICQRNIALWADKNAKLQALAQSCAGKSCGPVEKRKNFSADERAHWISVHRKQPPKGC